MDTDTPATKFGSQPENKKSFTYDGPTDEEIILGGMLVYGLYAFHCFARNSPHCNDAHKSVIRLISTVSWDRRASQILNRHLQQLDSQGLRA